MGRYGSYGVASCSVCDTEFEPCRAKMPTCSKTCSNKLRSLRRYGVIFTSALDSHLFLHYGIRESDYLNMLASQGFCCALCGWRPMRGYRRLSVDHDHTTNRVRGLLCYTCNASLALVDKQGIEKINAYLLGVKI